MNDILLAHLADTFGAEAAEKIELRPVPEHENGDIALSFFRLSKEMQKSPMEIAAMVKDALQSLDMIQEAVAAGPYCNVTIAPQHYFNAVMNAPLSTQTHAGQHILIEYSSPNTNKPLHIGHSRNNALGGALSSMYEAAGAKVTRVSIINNRGTHICKSMLMYLRNENGETPEQTGEKPDHLVGRYYRNFTIAAEKNPEMEQEAQAMLQQWEAGDVDVRALWERMNEWVYAGWNATYERQRMRFDQWYYESEIYVDGKAMVDEGLQKGLFYKKDDGAVAVDLADYKLDEKILQRSDGTSIYITQDLALACKRQAEHEADKMIYITAIPQNYHFQVLFILLNILGKVPQKKLSHIGYGLISLPEGKMSSRKGTVIQADAAMDELHNLAFAAITERNPQMPEPERREAAEEIMNGAWKFYMLSVTPKKGIVYDAERAVRFEGSTGPYLQYAGVRIQSLFQKSGVDMDSITGDAGLLGDAEKPLGAKILEWQNVLERAVADENPTTITTYLLELTQSWSSYYASTSVLNAESEEIKNARLLLARKVYTVLKNGLNLLGIDIPKKM